MSDERRCRETTRAGRPCKMAPLHDSEYCWAHDPSSRPAAAKARRRGGRVRQGARAGDDLEDLEEVRLEEAADVLRLLERAIAAELSLPNSTRRNRSIGYLGGHALKALEAAEIEERLEALERRFEMMGGAR